MTRSAIRLGRFGGTLLALVTTFLLLLVLSGVASAGTFTVNSQQDDQDANPGDGQCASEGTGDCTLRAAVQETNALGGQDTIILPGGAYGLTERNQDTNNDGLPDPEDGARFGDLDITGNTTIRGAGDDTTFVDGASIPEAAEDRVFDVRPGAVVRITGITIQNGSADRGGGISNEGTLTLADSTVRDNDADFGGGINNQGGLLTVERTTVGGGTDAGNQAFFGGGIYNEATLVLRSSSVSDNAAVASDPGGGGEGGGIYNDTAFGMELSNSTIARNTAQERGGGIANEFGDLLLTNVTLNENAVGGGIILPGSSVPEGSNIANNQSRTSLKNTIVANGEGAKNCAGASTTSRGNNLEDDDSCGLNQTSDQANAEPNLGEIPDNDSPTIIYEPQGGSPAIDRASNAACPRADQRGFKRPRDGDGNNTFVCDVGAVEAPGPLPPPNPRGCTITGTPGNDVLLGTPGNDVICGLGGADRIHGGGGNDTIYGDAGSDPALNGEQGNDRIFGGNGQDDRVSDGADNVNGGSGTDTLNTRDSVGDDTLNGSTDGVKDTFIKDPGDRIIG